MSILCSIAKIKEARDKKTAEQRPVDLAAESSSTSEVQTVWLSKVLIHSYSSLGVLDYEAAVDATIRKRRGLYQLFSLTERYDIGKHAMENGAASTLRKC